MSPPRTPGVMTPAPVPTARNLLERPGIVRGGTPGPARGGLLAPRPTVAGAPFKPGSYTESDASLGIPSFEPAAIAATLMAAVAPVRTGSIDTISVRPREIAPQRAVPISDPIAAAARTVASARSQGVGTGRASALTTALLGLWLCTASCSKPPPPAPAAATASGHVVGDGVTVDPALLAYAKDAAPIPAEAGLKDLFADDTLRSPEAVRRTVTGIFNGIESPEMGLFMTGIMLDRLGHVDGYSAATKKAWGTFVNDGLQLLLHRFGITLRKIVAELGADMANPEFLMTVTVRDREYLCQNLPPVLGAHLAKLQAENVTAMTLYAGHVRWLLSVGAGKTEEERSMLIAGLLGSKTIVRGDLSELLDRYRSPGYERALRTSVANPLAQYVPGELPGMLDLYNLIIRSGWTRFWDNFAFLTGYSGLGGMLGMFMAGALLGRRRRRRTKATQDGISSIVQQKHAAAEAAIQQHLEHPAQSLDEAAAQREAVAKVPAEFARAVELMSELVTPKSPRFLSKSRWKLRGEALAFYVPSMAIMMFLGASIQAVMENRAQQHVPLLLPELRPTMVQQIGVGYAQTNDLDGYPEAVVTLLNELGKQGK